MSQDGADKPITLHEQALAVGEIAEWFANAGDKPGVSIPEFERWTKSVIAASKTLFWLADNADLVREAHARKKQGR